MRNLLRILVGLISIGLILIYFRLCIQDFFPVRSQEDLFSDIWWLGLGQSILIVFLSVLSIVGILASIILPLYFSYQFVFNREFRFWWEKD